MTNPLELTALRMAELPRSSRYHGVAITTATTADGRVVRVMGRRFLPRPSTLRTVSEVRVDAGMRDDLLALEHLGDPLQTWRLWDANGVLHPEEIEIEGRTLRVALPDGSGGGGGR